MKFRLLINGVLVDGPTTLDVINPATGEVFEKCARADEALLNQAIRAAKHAYRQWSALPHPKRGECLRRLAAAIAEKSEELATLLTQEQGKPIAQSRMEIVGAVAALNYYSEQGLPVEVIRETAEGKILEQRSPLGVVAAITPWNFPVMILVMKIAPALITGNTLVAKPSPMTPLTSAFIGALAADIFPPGVVNVIIDDNDLGAILSSHPDVAKVTFTGSTATGKRVMQGAASTLKRLTLELGGNDAAIILDDVDAKQVASKIFDAAMINCGQVCLAAKRIYVPDSLYEAVCQELGALATQAIVGDGLNADTQVGPLQNKAQYEKVLELIEDARSQGEVIAGGEALARPGYFIAPTIIKNLPESARLVQEEQFGPVIPVLAYHSIDEVIDRANNSDYGLGATVWSKDHHRGLEVAMRIDSGTVWVNKHLDMPFDVSFGGAKQSGIGREQGLDGLKEFTQAKVINLANRLGA
ncbi:aldehyde dehydrogenase family protein [Pseudomonas sp. NCHU5208]|uniref:aldehyde dehydrogenase family protein n=1 Tax=unclassified Pseudomonas TaxID=196821 RepID=UPI003F9CE5A8